MVDFEEARDWLNGNPALNKWYGDDRGNEVVYFEVFHSTCALER